MDIISHLLHNYIMHLLILSGGIWRGQLLFILGLLALTLGYTLSSNYYFEELNFYLARNFQEISKSIYELIGIVGQNILTFTSSIYIPHGIWMVFMIWACAPLFLTARHTMSWIIYLMDFLNVYLLINCFLIYSV